MKNSEALTQWLKANCPIYEYMDLTINSMSNEFYSCSVPMNAATGNHINTVHAAFQWASAEMIGGLAVLACRSSESFVPVVRGVNIVFKKPATSAIVAEAHFSDADAKKMNEALETGGRYDFELDVTIKNTSGEVVAEATGSYAVRATL